MTTQSFFTAVDKAFSDGAHLRLQISCSRGKPVDVYINLPAELPTDATLAELITKAQPNFNNTCGSSFEVDAIGL